MEPPQAAGRPAVNRPRDDAGVVAPGGRLDTAAAIRSVHARYGGALFAFAYRSVGDRQAAEEIVQDTLVRAWQHADRFDPQRGSLQTWLFSIARNLAIDHLRRRGARPRTTGGDGLLDDRPDEGSARELDRALETWQVAEALHRLSAEHRTAIVATYYRGLSVAEAAAELGIPEGTVKSRVYYGLRSLRSALEEMGAVP